MSPGLGARFRFALVVRRQQQHGDARACQLRPGVAEPPAGIGQPDSVLVNDHTVGHLGTYRRALQMVRRGHGDEHAWPEVVRRAKNDASSRARADISAPAVSRLSTKASAASPFPERRTIDTLVKRPGTEPGDFGLGPGLGEALVFLGRHW